MRQIASEAVAERRLKSKAAALRPVVSDVYPIYVSGYESYKEIMQYVSIMEMNRKQNPVLIRMAEEMRDWTRDTPILRLLQPICGPETGGIMEKMMRKNIHSLSDLRRHYTPEVGLFLLICHAQILQFFINMNIHAILASNLSSVYLNWRNLVECYEISTSKQEEV